MSIAALPAGGLNVRSPRPSDSGHRLARCERPRLAIFHLITRLERGGSSECTLLQAIGAARRGHRVLLASGPSTTPSPLLLKARDEPNLELLEIPDLIRRISPLRDLRCLLTVARLIRTGRFDVLHTHTSKAGVLGRLASRLSGHRPAVIHQPHGHLFYGYYGPLGTALIRFLERQLAPLADVQITLSRRGAEEHLCRGIGRPGGFATIRSGIDLSRFRHARRNREAARARLGYRPEHGVIGTLCRLEKIKGVEDLLEGFALAAATRPGLRLFLGGDGPLAEPLRERACVLGLGDRVAIAREWVAPETVLPAFDLFVLPSRNEGMGRALVEAMATGCPVAASAVGGVPEVIEEGQCGLLIPPRDPRAISLAIVRVLDDAVFARTLSTRGRTRAISFGAGRMNHALLRLYRKVTS
ncbi:MAG: glycosyltransferase [Acidobacteria bacterium]|nr:glycosyltransferase [Acidobacteriota bacterium]